MEAERNLPFLVVRPLSDVAVSLPSTSGRALNSGVPTAQKMHSKIELV